MSLQTTESTITDRGRVFCRRLTDELYANYPENPHEGWSHLTAVHDFDWSVGSGNRVVGRLPDRVAGDPLIRGPHSYVLKVEFGVTEDDTTTDLGNWVEATIWKQASERGVADLFTPVVAHASDYRWLVMEEVETIGYDHPRATTEDPNRESTPQRREYERLVETFERRLDDAGLGLGIDGAGQAGVSQSGRVVALDYEHVTDESDPGQTAWVGSYDQRRDRRLTPEDVDVDEDVRERLHRLASGADGSVTGYEIRSRLILSVMGN